MPKLNCSGARRNNPLIFDPKAWQAHNHFSILTLWLTDTSIRALQKTWSLCNLDDDWDCGRQLADLSFAAGF
jgi:hypothetical protein